MPPYSLFPVPCSLFPSRHTYCFPTPYSLLPTPYSLLPTPYSHLTKYSYSISPHQVPLQSD
ncbi:MAG: hypothetical protein F6J90_04725 [Moorea sp. SIOASIH]|uniref:hypothetical protein n=1 Tax=Moorena sp. SIOASIH TaxID=2607817 RepID=UPI0013BB0C6B|nr:hypothetical protein [Moorena sp. SIOASIH]NEO35660.1 hypothetical protein [Moorena sp. SIOASIH]